MESVVNQFCLLKYEDPEVSMPLFDENLSGVGPNVSVVIGPNGSGKSRMLSRIVDELCFIDALRNSKPFLAKSGPIEQARIEYRIDGKNCVISRTGRNLTCTLNGTSASISDLPFPKRVAAVAHLPNDKFRFLRSEASDFYSYLGLRQATNLTTTGALETKVIQSLLVGFSKKDFALRLQEWLRLAGISNDVALEITLEDPDLLNYSFDNFSKSASTIVKKRSVSLRNSNLVDDQEWHTDLDNIWLLFQELRSLDWSGNAAHPSVSVELLSLSKPNRERIWIDGVDAARRRRLFRNLSLLIRKEGVSHHFSDLSSGEQHLIGTNARLLAELEPDSLVFIDEPEISLHPEWQIKYIPTLLNSLAATPSTHVVIATHSHFMVSDLDSEKSTLITSSNQDGKFKLFDGEVYGRSPENILYRVFGVATTGNSYVEGDLHSALQMLSKPESIDLRELADIYSRLEKVRGRDNPAMNIILSEVHKVLEPDHD